MATIEPRLIHLLNDSKSTCSSKELPPLQSFAFAKSAALPLSLPPLGLDLDHRSDPTPTTLPPAPLSQPIPPFSAFDPVEDASRRLALPSRPVHLYDPTARVRNANSLRLLLDDTSPVEPAHSLRKILDDVPPEPAVVEDVLGKKRQAKEDFVQLPQPLKKQKSAQQVMPPIINGLHEPPPKPPNAAVFPPISAVEFGHDHSVGLNSIKEFNSVPDERPAPVTPTDDKPAAAAVKTRRRTKPRRKWTEAETNHLLIGVSRHGVGKWTNILEDPDFRFNDRTAGDLKDRFRTCCPTELRGQAGTAATCTKEPQDTPGSAPSPSDAQPRVKRGPMLEDILIGNKEVVHRGASSNSSFSDINTTSVASSARVLPEALSESASKPRKSRAHRKRLEDLAELGIKGPFKKSHRRERRPFTDQDDKEIIQGINQYGPAWTKIQRDENFNLSSRQPTDLRDRVRNKYPEIYAKIEKGSFQVGKDVSPSHLSRGNSLLEPSVNTTIEYTLNSGTKTGGTALEPQLNRTGSRENIPKWPLQVYSLESNETIPTLHQVLEIHEHPPLFLANTGEMDISRVLMDESRL